MVVLKGYNLTGTKKESVIGRLRIRKSVRYAAYGKACLRHFLKPSVGQACRASKSFKDVKHAKNQAARFLILVCFQWNIHIAANKSCTKKFFS